jgi:AraC-like DNA-binding protein
MKRKRGHDATGRTKGEQRHLRLYHWFTGSPAWRALKPVERTLYVELCQRYNGSNNGRLGLSVRDAAEALHVSKSTAARAFRTLVERGFIDTVRRGHFDRKKRHASEWRLTEHKCDVTGEVASKRFMRWSREEKAGPSGGTVGPSDGTPALKKGSCEARNHPHSPT